MKNSLYSNAKLLAVFALMLSALFLAGCVKGDGSKAAITTPKADVNLPSANDNDLKEANTNIDSDLNEDLSVDDALIDSASQSTGGNIVTLPSFATDSDLAPANIDSTDADFNQDLTIDTLN